MGRRNKIKKNKVVNITDIQIDNTDYSIKEQVKEEKRTIFSLFERSKNKTLEDVNKKLDNQSKKLDNLKNEKSNEVQQEVSKKSNEVQQEVSKKSDEVQQEVSKKSDEVQQEVSKKSDEVQQEVQQKKSTFDSLLSNIKILENNFQEEKTNFLMKEIFTTKKVEDKNIKIIEDNQTQVLKLKDSCSGYIIFTNLDDTENIKVKIWKHRYSENVNYLVYNNNKAKIQRINTIIKIKKENNRIILSGNNQNININLKNKKIDTIKILNIKKDKYTWI